ncbi:disulfide bond formation protein B [Sphingomonas sp. LY160]|uniref:disulfide bond formation protein B n=1 Tax=Sphingomonas sp. LY160 TaxID=3095342 RepID=UPI002ADEE8B7|nr:disulfide bond formation protein B [Sphingomonas sp. LY160]MEA1072092.1 disulfide bond formation protein B [Sphingomonas sp. LY160]
MLAPPGNQTASLGKARVLALVVPGVLLGGALLSQFVGGLYPCEMCHWQRWPHVAALVLATIAVFSPIQSPRVRPLVLLAALVVAVSGAIGVFHAGVEFGWWEGLTTCTTSGATSLEDIMSVPLVRCDQVQWSFLGLSLAAWNAIISFAGAAAIAVLATRRTRR